jgi:hypothetical protein
LDLVYKVKLELRKIPRRFHECSLPPAPLGPLLRATMVGVWPHPLDRHWLLQEGLAARMPMAGVWGL